MTTVETSLLVNLPEEDLNEENDLFNILPKAIAIKNILLKYPNDFEKNKMIVMYGSWGTGKTSLMKYLLKELNKSIPDNSYNVKYKTIFFEAWKYENDNNLPLSLLEKITDEVLQSEHQQFKNDLITAGKTLFKFGENLLLNTKIKALGIIDIDLGKAGSQTIDEVTKSTSNESFYSITNKFEEKFKQMESFLPKNDEKILVFIDDLDRCEPENILNLLSSIKLFFTYGSKTIFFSGIDKDAVREAIQHKYGDVIKSEEYLEKIFDISFNIPKSNDFKKMIYKYFSQYSEENKELLNIFFSGINFTVPRHIKKVLNKFEIIKRFGELSNNSVISELNNSENIFHTIFTLYFIVLFEFYPKSFDRIINYELKLNNQLASIVDNSKRYGFDSTSMDANGIITKILEHIPNLNVNMGFFNKEPQNVHKDFYVLFNLFTPYKAKSELGGLLDPQTRSDYVDNDFNDYLREFDENNDDKILIDFCKYLLYLYDYFDKSRPCNVQSVNIIELLTNINLYL